MPFTQKNLFSESNFILTLWIPTCLSCTEVQATIIFRTDAVRPKSKALSFCQTVDWTCAIDSWSSYSMWENQDLQSWSLAISESEIWCKLDLAHLTGVSTVIDCDCLRQIPEDSTNISKEPPAWFWDPVKVIWIPYRAGKEGKMIPATLYLLTVGQEVCVKGWHDTRTDHVWIGHSLWHAVFWFVSHSAERCTFESPEEIMGPCHYSAKKPTCKVDR